uniref:Uncharacterized protein n=1 Tax=Arundo donax TaxID=35708 RepID=A0A0A9C6D5_ARUDO
MSEKVTPIMSYVCRGVR